MSTARKLALLAPLLVILSIISVGTYAGTSHVGAALIGVAHAADASPAAAAPVDSGLGLAGYIVLAVAVIGGALRILDVLIPGLCWLAPRTKTTLDDGALTVALDAHERLNQLEQVLGKFVPTSTPIDPAGDTRIKQSGFAAAPLVFALAVLAIVAGLLGGCSVWSAVKTDASAVASKIVTCSEADVPAVKALGLALTTEAIGQLVLHGSLDWTVLQADAEAGAKTQGLDVASCAFRDLVSYLNGLFNKPDALKVSSGGPEAFVDVAGGTAALAAFQDVHGIAAIQ